MSKRPLLEVAAWIAGIVSACAGLVVLVVTLWPRSPAEDLKQPAPSPPAAVQLNQPGSTGTQINGPVTIYPPVNPTPPTQATTPIQPNAGDQRQRPTRSPQERPEKSAAAPLQRSDPAGACLSSRTSLDSVAKRPYLASSYCETIRIGLQKLLGCKLDSLHAEPIEKQGFVTQYGLREPFLDQAINISYSSTEDCIGDRSGQFTASRRKFTQLNRVVYHDSESIHRFTLATTFGND